MADGKLFNTTVSDSPDDPVALNSSIALNMEPTTTALEQDEFSSTVSDIDPDGTISTAPFVGGSTPASNETVPVPFANETMPISNDTVSVPTMLNETVPISNVTIHSIKSTPHLLKKLPSTLASLHNKSTSSDDGEDYDYGSTAGSQSTRVVSLYANDPRHNDGRMLSTYDVENMLITFMAIITAFMILSLIIIIVIRIHYKARADEVINELETERHAKKTKTPSPFAVPRRDYGQDQSEFIPVVKARDGHHALYWKGDQVAAIVHQAAMAPVIPMYDSPEGMADYRSVQ